MCWRISCYLAIDVVGLHVVNPITITFNQENILPGLYIYIYIYIHISEIPQIYQDIFVWHCYTW